MARPASAPASSVAVARQPYRCLLAGEQRMLVAELFFGRSRVSDTAWAQFAADTITRNFPAGFTVFDADGQWQDPKTGRIARDRTKVVLIAAPRGANLAPRLGAVIDAYKARFRQQSVGVITRDSCADFD